MGWTIRASSICLWFGVLVGPAVAQPADCTPPPSPNKVDFALPCYFSPPKLGVESKVYFEKYSDALSDEARSVLDRQAEALLKLVNVRVVLFGHIDVDEAVDAEPLGLGRAEAVRRYLVSKGMPTGQISVASRGDRAVLLLRRTEETLAGMRFVSTEPQ